MKKEELQRHLDEKILPFWNSLRDYSFGGYYGYVDYELRVNKEAVKGSILNSRILWFYSNLYMLEEKAELKSYAEHAFTFLKDAFWDQEYGGVYWSVNYEGTVSDDTKHTYAQAFALYGLSSYYAISKNQEALELAQKIYQIIEGKCQDEYGYQEGFTRTFVLKDNKKLSENGVEAQKTMNTLLHVFEAYTEFYRVTRYEAVAKSLYEILDIFEKKVYNPKLRRQEVFFDAGCNSILDLHSYGHDIEATWLIDRGCEVLGDIELAKRMNVITDDLTDKVFERAYTGVYLLNECEKGIDDTTSVWWVQAESVVGFMNGYQKHPEKKEYYDAVKQLWGYILENMVDHRNGSEWFWALDKDANPIEGRPIVESWKCPYHNGRMCIEMIRRLEDHA